MIKKPSQFYDDLVVVGGNPRAFSHTQFPLIVVIAPPSGFFLGGLAVFFINLWFYLDDLVLWEDGLYYRDSKPAFPWAGIVVPAVMVMTAIILFFLFLSFYLKGRRGSLRKNEIFYSPSTMHFVFGSKKMGEVPIIPAYRIRGIHIDGKGFLDAQDEMVADHDASGTLTISYREEDGKLAEFRIKNVAEALIVGERMQTILEGGDYHDQG